MGSIASICTEKSGQQMGHTRMPERPFSRVPFLGIAMTAQRMCELGQVSRAGFYRFDAEREHRDQDLNLRDEIQRIALEFPSYGRPRITPGRGAVSAC